jgi:flagellar biosynthesis chaperone FliJ
LAETRIVTKRPRLERALDALARERKTNQRDLGEVTARRARLTGALERLERCRGAVEETSVVDPSGRLNRDMYLVSRGAEDRLTREMEGLTERLRRFDDEVTHPVRERLRASAIREKSVETLVERRRRSEAADRDRRERLALDELAAYRWLSQRTRK